MKLSRGLLGAVVMLGACTPLVASNRGDAGDVGVVDVWTDVGSDIGTDIGTDIGSDGGSDVGMDGPGDGGAEAGADAAGDVGEDVAAGDVGVDVAPFRCVANGDCADGGSGSVCDVSSGRCVECVASADTCPAGRYCVEATQQCADGCRNDEGCAPGASDGGVAGAARCNVATHACVACVTDSHCPPGNLCMGNMCVAGCSPSQACASGQTCCGGGCVDATSNVANCSACGIACSTTNGTAACVGGNCGVGACTAPFADCDGVATNGCEVDTATSAANCGACGTMCVAPLGGTARCVAGGCELTCPSSQAACGGMCQVTGTTCTAGLGPCLRSGITTCNAGVVACNVTAGAMTTETCDGIDNDCNGMIDDRLFRPCYTGPAGTAGVGSCSSGLQFCSAGSWGTGCSGQVLPSAEICDGLDNNCDGIFDGPAAAIDCPVRANSDPACVAGRCGIRCVAHFADCDNNPTNGCEVDLRMTASCGACGIRCIDPAPFCDGTMGTYRCIMPELVINVVGSRGPYVIPSGGRVGRFDYSFGGRARVTCPVSGYEQVGDGSTAYWRCSVPVVPTEGRTSPYLYLVVPGACGTNTGTSCDGWETMWRIVWMGVEYTTDNTPSVFSVVDRDVCEAATGYYNPCIRFVIPP